MDTEGLEIIRLELKYCERCGGLWLRARGSGDVFCSSCAVEMLDLPTRRTKKLHLIVNDRVEIKSQSDTWSVSCGEWGNA